ncbi:MAG: response regulator [Thiobacillaceae bacterium]|jgi:DNA-binding NarL/FixJ family response regulator|nr:response regulator [Thiobacillaceae bacterium]
MGATQKIFIVEDHTLLRAGLLALLSQDPGLEIVGEADNGRDAIRAVGTLAPDLVLMDCRCRG